MAKKLQVFISYARDDDEPFVEELHRDLTENGIEVWWDRKSMESRGRTFLQEIRDAIEGSDRVLAVIGSAALKSDYVRVEWEHTMTFCKGILPVLRQGDFLSGQSADPLEREVAAQHTVDFRPEGDGQRSLSELLRLLRKQVPKLGEFRTVVPSLPPHFVQRQTELDRLGKSVLADIQRPVLITTTKQTTALQGMGGIGKSVLAAAFARSASTRRAFNDGIVWIDVGVEAEPLTCLRQAGLALGGAPEHFVTMQDAKTHLPDLLAGKVYLIVLDDVWDVAQAATFRNALGPRCWLLITTRDGGLVSALGAQEERIDILTEDSALALLADWSQQQPAQLPPEAREVAKECGYLPLALALTGAQVRDGVGWSDILEALRNADLSFIRRQFPDYPYSDVFTAFQVSMDTLQRTYPLAAECYRELAVFPSDTAVPEAAVLTLWLHGRSLKDYEARGLLVTLERKALLRLSADPPRRVSLHVLLHDYLRVIAQHRLKSLNERLLEAYANCCTNGWATGPNDGYFFQHLARHLKELRRDKELRKLLLNIDWLQAKLAAESVAKLIADLDRLPDDEVLQSVLGAIRLSALVIAQDNSQLVSQLLGRLQGSSLHSVRTMLDQIVATQHKPALLPLVPCLTPPGGPLLQTLDLGSPLNAVVTAMNGRYAVAGGRYGIFKVWDLEDLSVRSLEGQTGEVTALAVLPDGRRVISGDFGGNLRIWDVVSGKQFPPMIGHTTKITAIVVTEDWHRAVSSSWDGLRIWNLDDGKLLDCIKMDWPGVVAMVVLPNKRLLTCPNLNLWNLEDLYSGPIESLGRSHFCAKYGALAATLDGTGVVFTALDRNYWWYSVLDLGSDTLAAGHNEGDIAVSSDGKHVVFGSWWQDIKVLDLHSGRRLATLKGHTASVHGVTLTPDGTRIISVSWDGTLKVWDFRKVLEGPRQFGVEAEILLVSSDRRRAITRPSLNAVELWDLTNRRRLKAEEGSKEHEPYVRGLVLALNTSQVLLALSDKTIRRWDIETGNEVASYPFEADSVVVMQGEELGVAFVGRFGSGIVKMMNLKNREVLEAPLLRCGGFGTAVVLDSGLGWNIRWVPPRTLELCSEETGQVISRFHPDAELDALAILPNSNTIAAKDATGRILMLSAYGANTDAASSREARGA